MTVHWKYIFYEISCIIIDKILLLALIQGSTKFRIHPYNIKFILILVLLINWRRKGLGGGRTLWNCIRLCCLSLFFHYRTIGGLHFRIYPTKIKQYWKSCYVTFIQKKTIWMQKIFILILYTHVRAFFREHLMLYIVIRNQIFEGPTNHFQWPGRYKSLILFLLITKIIICVT